MNDTLMVFYDNCPPDLPTLCVAKEAEKGFFVLNKIQGDAAFGVYHYLINGAELKNAKDIPMKVVCDGDDESDYVRCPCCNEILGFNDGIYDDFCYRNWKPMHCIECGQAMIWK